MDNSTKPAGPPPDGVMSNFDDPLSHAGNLIACNVVLLTASVIIVVARIVSRTILTDWRLGWDDWTMILALIGTSIFGAFVIETTKFGLGKNIWDVPMTTYSPGYLWWIMATFAACPASYYWVKVSILFFYLRVFQLQARLRYIIYALFIYCTAYYWLAFGTIVGLCNYKNKTWEITVQMNCFADGPLVFAIGGLDIFADIMVLAFPVPMVLKLKVSWPQRIYLLFIFLFGLTATAACAIRVAFAVQAKGTSNATMAQYRVVTLFCIEHYLALIAACMPTLGPLFRYLHPNGWKNLERKQQLQDVEVNEDEEAFHRKWPKRTHRSPDASLMHGSLKTGESNADKSSAYQYWPGQNMSRKHSEESPKGWAQESTELKTLPSNCSVARRHNHEIMSAP